jgi:hypothetical protein
MFHGKVQDVRLYLGGKLEGQVYKEIKVRELIGRDLAKFETAQPRKAKVLLNDILADTIIEIKNYEKPLSFSVKRQFLNSLCVGDRDIILLEVRKLTYGEEMDMTTKCPNCNEQLDVVINLNDIQVIPPKIIEDEWVIQLETGLLVNDVIHKDVHMKVPRVGELERYDTPSQIIAQAIRNIGDIVGSVEVLNELTVRDRDIIIQALAERVPKVDWTVKVECFNCGEIFSAGVDFSGFFRTPRIYG